MLLVKAGHHEGCGRTSPGQSWQAGTLGVHQPVIGGVHQETMVLQEIHSYYENGHIG
jgi:hypothetical protein